MSAASSQGDAAAVVDGDGPPLRMTAQGGLRGRVRSLCTACRQVFGMPDYERYLTHAAERHPGAPVLTRNDYFVQAIERKYGKGGMRCC